ncbi:MAG TPA: hypothetical protein VMM37_07330, partial [Bacteroidota bacterium]|nr:hypothetical protein [Bacteroidota bacterium]
VGAEGSLYLFVPHMSDNLMKPGGGVTFSYSAMEHLGIRAMFGAGQLGWKDANDLNYTTNVLSGNLYLSFDMIPHGTFNPFILAGVGGVYFDPRSDDGNELATAGISKFDLNYIGGAGFDIFFSEFVSMTVSGEYVYANTQNMDLAVKGANNSYARVNLEFRYYFFDQDYITKLLKALQARYEKK